ncbi:hypothetical protein J31TS4_26690 [Paenibacillus sp. J31TS4]|uniref:YetF domain-containing protein n=1 Tax=Paenibacillus sp. J31TS4 TaxID=2807195 RepID=UPI001B0E19F1|nr:YetF domain-containing protein [Paenibacillus sp. J31TS4]GIP39389.1 hypothetical protein J31TS4_26690 [Paenibacillus sp. J31TS4]
MHEYVHIIIRTIAAILLLLFIARIVGKQTVSNMTFHDFVTGITLGAIAGNLGFNTKINAWFPALSLIVLSGTSLTLSVLSIKSRKLRQWISGAPTVLIEGGAILEENMRKAKYTIDSLNQSLREKDIFDPEEVEYALLETNGRLSVRRKAEYLPATRKDLMTTAGGASGSASSAGGKPVANGAQSEAGGKPAGGSSSSAGASAASESQSNAGSETTGGSGSASGNNPTASSGPAAGGSGGRTAPSMDASAGASQPAMFPIELMTDGQLLEENLMKSGLTREELERVLKQKGKKLGDVFYAVQGTHKQLFFDYYEDHIQSPIDRER